MEKEQPFNNKCDGKTDKEGIDIRHLAEVLNMVNGMFCAYDADGQIVYMNQKFKNLAGYSDETLKGVNIIDLAIDRHKNQIRRRIQTRIEKDQEGSWELPMRTKDGKELTVIAKTAPLYQNNKQMGEILLIEDITERKRSEAKLRESQQRIYNIIESLPDAALAIDKEGRILHWNREMVALTGYPAEDMVGKGDYQYALPFYNGLRRPMLVDMIIKTDLDISYNYPGFYREGDILVTNNIKINLQGQEKIMWGRAAPLYDSQGQVIGAIETIRDITERYKATEEMKRNREQLQVLFDSTVHALAIALEKRDHYTAGHQLRVAKLASTIGEEMGLSENIIKNINIAGTLHDIGKIYVPLDILSQTNKLTEIQKLYLMTHSEAGYDIIKDIPFNGPIAKIIMQHHERIDGSGYPLGLKGDNILLEARIMAVADTVEAMTSHRPYRPALGIDRAMEEIQTNAGKIYDEAVVDACISILKKNKFQFDGSNA